MKDHEAAFISLIIFVVVVGFLSMRTQLQPLSVELSVSTQGKARVRSQVDNAYFSDKVQEHDYDDYASWVEDDWASPHIPSTDAIDTLHFRSSNCARPDRILYVSKPAMAGLTDRTGRIFLLAAMACRLQAQVWVTPPHTMLQKKFNRMKELPRNITWDRYTTFHTFVKETSASGDPIWQACPDRSVFTMDESGAPHLQDRITEALTFQNIRDINLTLVKHAMNNPEEPLFWNLKLEKRGWFKMESDFKAWHNELPTNVGRQCNVERLFGTPAVKIAEQVKQDHLGGSGAPYMSIKMRRTDDLKLNKLCTEPDRVASAVREVLLKRQFHIGMDQFYLFIMMSPEPAYRNQLEDALRSALVDLQLELFLVFESDSPVLRELEESENILAYSAAYVVLEDAPLGRIEARRFDRAEHQYRENSTCGIRYAKTLPISPLYKQRFMEVGYIRKFHQIFPEYIP